jgi:Zn-dependent protease
VGFNWWAADMWHANPALFASWVFWVIFSIVMHELSHGWAALRCGDHTPRSSGHMTWNPLVHMGHFSLIMFAIIGIAWGAMPVNPYNFRGRHDDAVVSAAGPAMNLGLAVVAALLSIVWLLAAPITLSAMPAHLFDNIRIFFFVGAAVNLALMLFNLFPVPPLDGSRILASYVPSFRAIIEGEKGPLISMIGIIIMFYAVGGRVFEWAFGGANAVIYGIVRGISPGAAP